MKKWFNTLSIRNKFFYSMMISSVIIVLTLTLTMNGLLYGNYITERTDASKSHLEYITKQLEFYMNSVENYSQTIISDPVIQDVFEQKASGIQDSNNYGSTHDLVVSTVGHIIQTTKYIHTVTLYNTDKEFQFSTANNPSRLPAAKDIDNVYGTWISTVQNSETSPELQIHTLSMYRPFFSYNTGKHLGYLEISIPESSIADIYSTHSTPTNSLFIVDGSGIIQSTADSTMIDTSFEGFSRLYTDNSFSSQFTAKTVTFSSYVGKLDWYVINQVKTTELLFSIMTLVFICITIGIICILIYIFAARKIAITITEPIHTLIEHTKTIKEGDWTLLPPSSIPEDKDIHSLFVEFNSMLSAQDQLKNELVETQIAKNKISLDLLNQQINPHFLYNTLDNICSLAEIGENSTLIHMVMRLSNFYRSALSQGQFYITIREELEITRAYLDIMKIRYYHQFEYEITYKKELEQCECIKLLLQPIVENSIYHGIKEMSGEGLIRITVTDDSSSIIITVADNGPGLKPGDKERIWAPQNDHFGIKNIHQRVQVYYGNSYGLTTDNSPEGGCITTITIPRRSVYNEL